MKVSLTRIVCDSCKRTGDERRTITAIGAESMREALRKDGWYSDLGKDLCPRCREKSEDGCK